MQQEEPRQPEVADQRQLLVQPRRRVGAQARCPAGSARRSTRRTRAASLRSALAVLGAGIAVAEVGGEVEDQRRGQALGLGDRVGVVLEACRHRRRRREDVAVVAAPQRLGGVERRVLADRHEHVLQPRARRLVGVDVARRDARQPEPSGQRGERAVARPVVARETGAAARPGTRRGRRPPAARAAVGSSWTPRSAQPDRQTRPSACSARSASVSTGASTRRRPGRLARVRVRPREQPAEVAPASPSRTSSVRCRVQRAPLGIADHAPSRCARAVAGSTRSTSAPWIARRPSDAAACANSIDPETELWSVSASAWWPRSSAATTSSSGSEAPSRNEKAEWQWSSTYDTNICSHTGMTASLMPRSRSA